jgi:hypothetical protein
MKTILAMLALSVLVMAAVWERNAIGMLRAHNEALRAEKLEIDRLAAENSDLPKVRMAVASAPQVNNAELLRLRNEVRTLRAQQPEIAKLRAASQRIAEEIKTGKFTPRRLMEMEGTVSRKQWVFAGFATPEAAAQSLVAAIAADDPSQIIRCATPTLAEEMKKTSGQDPQKFREQFLGDLTKLGGFAAFRVTFTRSLEDGRVEVFIQGMDADGRMPQPQALPLRRVGNEWKLEW